MSNPFDPNNPYGSTPEQNYDPKTQAASSAGLPTQALGNQQQYGPPSQQQPQYGATAQPPYGQYGPPSGQQPQYGQQYGPPSGQQPQYGQQYGPPSGQQPQYGQQYGPPSGQQPYYGQQYGPPSGQPPYYGQPGQMPPVVGGQYYVPTGGSRTGMRATIGKRFGALFIDGLIYLVFALIAGFVFAGIGGGSTFFLRSNSIVFELMVYLLWAAYFLYFYSTSGQTLGKRAVGVRVVRRDGRPLDVSTGLRRVGMMSISSIGGLIVSLLNSGSRVSDASILTLLFSIIQLLDYLWAFWDAEQQTLHDKVADTLVVDA